MSYTSADAIKKHINLNPAATGKRCDYAVTFAGAEWISLPGYSVMPGSVRIKALKECGPTMEMAVFIGDQISLAHKPLIVGSATVASDTSLGIVYRENRDYMVNHADGEIIRLPDGDIASGAGIVAWYFYWSQFVEGVDFSVNYSSGAVRRLAAGGIGAGQTVMVDYELSAFQPGDEAIEAAVAEADAILEKDIDPGKSRGADAALQTAATYLAMSILCRILAANERVSGSNNSSSGRSTEWLNLVDSYRADYERLIKIFRPMAARPSGPAIS
jgi:hypothetical protein